MRVIWGVRDVLDEMEWNWMNLRACPDGVPRWPMKSMKQGEVVILFGFRPTWQVMHSDLHPAMGILMVEELDLDGFLLVLPVRLWHQVRTASHAIACSGYWKVG